MSTFRRTAHAARRGLLRARARLGGHAGLVGLVQPRSWSTDLQLHTLEEALREAAADARLLVGAEGEDPAAGADPDDLLLLLEPDSQVDAAALAEALAAARDGGSPVVAGTAPVGLLDPRDVLATAAAWTAAGTTPSAATADDVLVLLGTDPVRVRSWWSPGSGDAGLPLTEQRRFRSDLAQARTRGLLDALDRLRRTRPQDVDDWRIWMLQEPLPGWYADAVGGGPAYFEALQPLVRALVADLPPSYVAQVPVSARRAAYVAAHADLPALALLLDHDGDHPDGLPARDGLVEGPESGPTVPESWRRVEDVDRVSHALLLHAWRDGRGVHLAGAAWTDHAPADSPPVVEVEQDGTWVPVATEAWDDPQVVVAVGRAHEDHPHAGFRCVLPDLTGPVRVRVASAVHVLEPARAPEPPAGAPMVVSATVAGGALRLDLDRPDPGGHLALRGPLARAHAGASDGTTLTLPLTTTVLGEDGWLPSGSYRVEGAEVGVDPALLADPPELRDGALGVTLAVGPAGRLQVRVATALRATERGARHQQLLRERASSRPLRPGTVLLEAFHGRSAGDNPGPVAEALRAIEPGLDLAMVVDDPRVRPPQGVRAVVRRSAEWHDLLRTAAAYVGNAAAPSWWTKAPGQVHLQTWHGTPLKRIGEDRGPGDLTVWRHRRDVASQATGWDALVSANPLSSRAFRSAFGYTGELLESGYPRNDLLVDRHRRDQARAEVRRTLGLREDQRVVLYAPTWREYAGTRNAKPLFLDAPRLVEAVPDAVVLVRGHYNAGKAADAFPGVDRVLDVTRHPDVAPLFCAADVLVTDYSSVMFDFAILDRPIVLLVPDLEQYRDVERGFYLDLESRAPGDLVRTTDEVVDRLAGDAGTDDAAEAAARAAFREEFCPWEDGHAADRVARWLLARLG